MKIKSEQLARSLQKAPTSLYWLTGDEPLLMQEAADVVRAYFREAGFIEREVFDVDKNFNWEDFAHEVNNLSLFAAQKILELRLTSAKLEEAGKTALQTFIQEPNPDLVVLISSPRLDASTLKTKWCKAIEAKSTIVQIWPVNRENLGPWLEKRLIAAGIQPDSEAIGLLMDKVEGNLLAAMQEIEKLKLLANVDVGQPIQLDGKTVMQVVADSARFNAYHMVDAALSGEAARAQRMLAGLRSEGTFPLVILSALTRELRNLLPMIEKRDQGQAIAGIVQAAHVWFNRKQAVSSALRRLNTTDIWQLLEQARRVDQSIKGMSLADPWVEISQMLLTISGHRVATMAAAAR